MKRICGAEYKLTLLTKLRRRQVNNLSYRHKFDQTSTRLQANKLEKWSPNVKFTITSELEHYSPKVSENNQYDAINNKQRLKSKVLDLQVLS